MGKRSMLKTKTFQIIAKQLDKTQKTQYVVSKLQYEKAELHMSIFP